MAGGPVWPVESPWGVVKNASDAGNTVQFFHPWKIALFHLNARDDQRLLDRKLSRRRQEPIPSEPEPSSLLDGAVDE